MHLFEEKTTIFPVSAGASGTGSGHVPRQDTTANTSDLFSTQMSHEVTMPHGVHDIAPAGDRFVGCPATHNTPQGVSWFHPPTLVPQPMSPLSVIHHVPTRPLGTGSLTPIGGISLGPSTCRWTLQDGSFCGQEVAVRTVPQHLVEHGIRGMYKGLITFCLWEGCGKYLKRRSITRHIREVHLGSKRKSHIHVLPRDGLCH